MSDVLAAGSLDQLVRPHPAGTVLFREGDKGDKMYVIRSGKVKIVKHIADSDITLAVLGTGEFFGEMALLEGLPRSAEATVAEDALLIEVEGPAFDTLVRKNGEIAVRLMRRLSACTSWRSWPGSTRRMPRPSPAACCRRGWPTRARDRRSWSTLTAPISPSSSASSSQSENFLSKVLRGV